MKSDLLFRISQNIGFLHLTSGQVVMWFIAASLIYLGIKKRYEPYLMLPMGFGIIVANLPLVNLMESDGIIGIIHHYGISKDLLPLLIFMGVGALTDFGPLLSNPVTFIIGAAAQLGIPLIMMVGLLIGFDLKESASIGIIGCADGPIIIYAASKLAPHLLGVIGLAGYSYMAMVPIIQPPVMKLLTTKNERRIVMKQKRPVSGTEKIMFSLVTTIVIILIVPESAPIVIMLMVGNLFREAKVVSRLHSVVEGELLSICTIFLGVCIGATMNASLFFRKETLLIFFLGLVNFALCSAFGIIAVKILNLFRKDKINPLIGSAGVSAVPMAARISHLLGRKEDPDNWLLMHAMGPNVAGVVASSVLAGIFLSIFI
jgi:sodium ion-translocating decarboxylase beta subunit